MSDNLNTVRGLYRRGLLIRGYLWSRKIAQDRTNNVEKLAKISLLQGDFPLASSLAEIGRPPTQHLKTFVDAFIQQHTTGYELSHLRPLVFADEDRNVDSCDVEDKSQRFYIMPDYVHESLWRHDSGRVTSTADLPRDEVLLVEKGWLVKWKDEMDCDSDVTISITESLFRRLYEAWEVSLSWVVSWTGEKSTIYRTTPMKHFLAQIVRSGTFKTILGDAIEGCGFFPLASLFKHSCAPNVEWFNMKDVIVLLTSEPIEKDQELCISLIDQSQCFDGRAEALDRLFHITCTCQRCIVEGELEEVSRREVGCCCHLCTVWKAMRVG